MTAIHEASPMNREPAQNDQKKSSRVDPKDWCCLTKPLVWCFLFFFRLAEIYVVIVQRIRKHKVYDNMAIRSIGSRTVITRSNSFQRKDSTEVLKLWLSKDQVSDQIGTTYTYRTFADAFESVAVSTSFAAHGKHMAYLVLSDPNLTKTIAHVVDIVKRLKVRACRSVKFRFLFRLLIQFLEDIEKSRASSVTDFVQVLARDMQNRPSYWYIDFVHKRIRAAKTPRHVYETALATLSLFFREGAGLEAYVLKGTWKSPDRYKSAVLTLLMYCAVENCVPTTSKEINVTEFSGVERILLAHGSNETFHRYVSRTSTKSDELFKDKMMWDITLNCCNEYIESCWSTDALERAIWALQYCREDGYKDVYHQLKELNGRRNLDLTHLRAVILVGLSVSGMVQFDGMNDCVYRATGDPQAKVKIHGNLPLPTIKELVAMNLLKEIRKGAFEVKRVPGSEKKFKGVRIGDRVRLTQSRKAEMFSCELTEKVG